MRTVSIPNLMTRLMHFYAHESCAVSAPRAGRARRGWSRFTTGSWQAAGRHEDIDILLDICNNIGGRSFCALGDAAAMPIQGAMKLLSQRIRGVDTQGKPGQASIFAPLPIAAGH